MPTVAVLYLCTGAYVAFWHDFYPNFKAHFLPDCARTFFVFTDAGHIDYEGAPDVVRIPQTALPWPYSTMQRFDAFLGQADRLAGYDYLFFATANLRCMRDVPAAELLPDPAACKPPMPLIVNGALSRAVMDYCCLDPAWIESVLRRERLGIQDILLMLCDEQKDYTIIRKS